MFRSRVASFYRERGYEVRENVRVRGASQNVYTLDMVADGPLGALLVSFGDAAGIDAQEIARVRTLARDIGATPVLAAPHATAELRRIAAQLTVVLLEETSLDDPAPKLPGPALADPVSKDIAAHPWPDSGRSGPVAGPDRLLEAEQVVQAAPTPAAWHPGQSPAPSPAPTQAGGNFAWLDNTNAAPSGPRAPLPPPAAPKPLEHLDVVEAVEPVRRVRIGRLALYVGLAMLALWILSHFV